MEIKGRCSGEVRQGWNGDGQPVSLGQSDFGGIYLKEISGHG